MTLPRWALTVISLMPKLGANLLIQQAGDHQVHDLAFAGSEQCAASPKQPHLVLIDECRLAALDCLTDGAQQLVVVEWFGEELNRAGLHGPDRHWHIAMAGDEDDRHVDVVGGDALLKFKTIEVRKIKSSTRQLGTSTRG